MNFYKQSIIFFGVVIPLIVGIAVVGVGYFMKNKMSASYEVKKENYLSHNKARSTAEKLEEKVIVIRPHLERWDEHLGKQTSSEVVSNLRDIIATLPEKEIQQTAFDPSNNSGGMGKSSAQPSSQLRIGFRGTYRTLQKAFLELETRMPHLQLEDFSIQPIATSGYLLSLQVTYTAWEK